MHGSMLIVDQDAATRELVAGNFRNAGYRVHCACDLSEGEALLRSMRPDVTLLGWAPGAPGLTFARQLRSDRRTADTSIIVLSANANEQDTVAALESGADDYVAKPLCMRELLARVKAVLRRRAPQLADEAVELAGLRIDPAARRVSADGRAVELRKIEYTLLHFFMTHPRRTFSRRTLLDAVWGDDVFVEERTVDVHVRRLRRALAPSHDRLIETVRGVGYQFCAEPQARPVPALHSSVSRLAMRTADRLAWRTPAAAASA